MDPHQFRGAPGTVLDPLLFLMYTNDLPNNSTVRLVADYSVMYVRIKGSPDFHQLQSDLNTLSKWQDTWQMRFNTLKCFVLHLSHARSPKQFK